MDNERLVQVKDEYAPVVKRTQKRLRIWIVFRLISVATGIAYMLSILQYAQGNVFLGMIPLFFSVVITVLFAIGIKNGIQVLTWLMIIGGVLGLLSNMGAVGTFFQNTSILLTIYGICTIIDSAVQLWMGLLIRRDKEYEAYAMAVKQLK